MAGEKLIVRNFGPIREAEIELRKLTVFIGQQASGKSCLAKLISIFQDISILKENNKSLFDWWEEKVTFFSLDGFSDTETFVQYQSNDFQATITHKKGKLEYINKNLKRLVDAIEQGENDIENLDKESKLAFEKADFERAVSLEAEKGVISSELIKSKSLLLKASYDLVYIPTERIITSFPSNIRFDRAYYLTEYIQEFEKQKKLKKEFTLNVLGVGYYYEEETGDRIVFSNSIHDIDLPLEKAASGIQSFLPIQIMMDTVIPLKKYSFVVEEPEINLYPATQKKIVEYIVEKGTKGDNRVVLTTHSPYILTALNILIAAKEIANADDATKSQVNKLVPPQYQIDFQDVTAYFVSNGVVKNIMNESDKLIDAQDLDDISNDMSHVFNQLLDLKYAD